MAVPDVFLRSLVELYDVEATLADEVLPELLATTSEGHFREAIEEHMAQTRTHVRNLEEVFAAFGEKPQRARSVALEGLRRQHRHLLDRAETPDVRDLVNAAAGAHTEHYEISAYHSLISLATMLGEPEVVATLERNLHDEEEALAKLEKSIPERLSARLTARSGALQ